VVRSQSPTLRRNLNEHPIENGHVPTAKETQVSILPISEARPQVLLKTRTAKIIIDIATISEKQNCGHSTLTVLSSDVFSRLSLEIGLFSFKIQIITFTQILPFFPGVAVLGHSVYQMTRND
jgi:hypothetical protein